MKYFIPILSTTEKAVQEALKQSGRDVLALARDLSPTDSGDSDKSGFVRVDDLTVQVGFTSLVSKLQHENLDWQHLDGGQAKFLEAAGDEVDIGAIAAKAMRAEFGG